MTLRTISSPVDSPFRCHLSLRATSFSLGVPSLLALPDREATKTVFESSLEILSGNDDCPVQKSLIAPIYAVSGITSRR